MTSGKRRPGKKKTQHQFTNSRIKRKAYLSYLGLSVTASPRNSYLQKKKKHNEKIRKKKTKKEEKHSEVLNKIKETCFLPLIWTQNLKV